MTRLLLVPLCALLFVWSTTGVSSKQPLSYALTASTVTASEPTITPAPVVTATSYAVIDMETGELLFSHDESTPRPIASITKLVTAAAMLEAELLEETVTIEQSDIAAEGRAGKLEAGQTLSYRELLFPLLLESSNDAAATVERATDENIITVMNSLTEGITDVSFADASGLSERNRASAAALATLLVKLYDTYPYVFDVSSLSQSFGTYTGWRNNSPVVSMDEYRGGKHGYTEAAARTIAAVFTEGERTVGYVVLGSDALVDDVAALRAAVHASDPSL